MDCPNTVYIPGDNLHGGILSGAVYLYLDVRKPRLGRLRYQVRILVRNHMNETPHSAPTLEADDIRTLFIDLYTERGIPDVRVFRDVLDTSSDPAVKIGDVARKVLRTFCLDVSTCPAPVLAHARYLAGLSTNPVPPSAEPAPSRSSHPMFGELTFEAVRS